MNRFVLLGGSYVNASAVLIVQPLGPDTCQLHLVGVPIGHAPHKVSLPADTVIDLLTQARRPDDEG